MLILYIQNKTSSFIGRTKSMLFIIRAIVHKYDDLKFKLSLKQKCKTERAGISIGWGEILMECFHLHKFFSLVEYLPLIMQNSFKLEFDSPSPSF